LSVRLPRLPYAWARANGVFIDPPPAGGGNARLVVRAGAALAALAEAQRFIGAMPAVEPVTAEEFERRLARSYADSSESAESAQDLADTLGQDEDFVALVSEARETVDLMEAEDQAPIIRMINAMLVQALRSGASDIHFEPYEGRSVIRFRTDGMLHDVVTPPRAVHAALASRIKVMAELDIAEKRLPQDGRIALRVAGRQVDVRVSTLPTGHGERVVLRLLDKASTRLDLAALGMDAPTIARVDAAIRQPHGLFLVTGPTGSGKTTTLYAGLQRLDRGRLNILTVEDPIEYDLAGVGQTQVNPKIALDFARALRAILRQDPDVVMIGEIRDAETAQIAIQASLTGHLVLATLHTNDSASAVTRLVDMGVEPFLVSSSLVGVLSQRLVRRLCAACRTASDAATHLLADLGTLAAERLRGAILYEAKGCPACHFTGYRGRLGIYEHLPVDARLRQLVHDRAAEAELAAHGAAHGMKTLREDGLRWIAAGETSVQELLRVTRE
jgi:general secretion pathway protein E